MCFQILGSLLARLVAPLINIGAKRCNRAALYQSGFAGKNGYVMLVAIF